MLCVPSSALRVLALGLPALVHKAHKQPIGTVKSNDIHYTVSGTSHACAFDPEADEDSDPPAAVKAVHNAVALHPSRPIVFETDGPHEVHLGLMRLLYKVRTCVSRVFVFV